MKQLSAIDRIVFFFNSAIAAMLLLSYVLPYVEPQNFALLSVLSLAVPLLIILNILFVIYWLLKVKKQLFLSLIVLLIGYSYVGSLHKFSASKNVKDAANISVMNFNVRLFNLYNWIPEDDVDSRIVTFLTNEQPDIVCFQEFHPHQDVDLSFYPYKYEHLSGKRIKYGQAIYSKYPIVNSGSIEFKNTANNAIYADIVRDKDTVRVYNVHLQSSGINPQVEELKKEKSERLFRRAATTFKMQQEQAELVLEHKQKSPYKTIISGDFNNTAYSYVYSQLQKGMVDTFEAAGNGFGSTFDFRFFPVRIDFILADKAFEINHFKTYNVKLSDHYPILTRLKLKE